MGRSLPFISDLYKHLNDRTESEIDALSPARTGPSMFLTSLSKCHMPDLVGVPVIRLYTPGFRREGPESGIRTQPLILAVSVQPQSLPFA